MEHTKTFSKKWLYDQEPIEQLNDWLKENPDCKIIHISNKEHRNTFKSEIQIIYEEKIGYWIIKYSGHNEPLMAGGYPIDDCICSNCLHKSNYMYKYCCNCGTKMSGDIIFTEQNNPFKNSYLQHHPWNNNET